ncbi:hypothetical protein Tco_0299886 [Tanacetum coccineum]
MANLKFADTHNMVACLAKPAESKGFEQIVDFLNAHTIKRDLQLEDAEGVDCLPNATIFEQVTLMGSKTTTWNEFSSTMASAIICLATNQKFNFSKYIFESMVKNLDNVSGNFLMYPRFVQVFVNQQLEGMPTHKRIYIAPSHTKKIFRNMRRVGKGFSRRETPLFQTMMVQDQEEVGEGSEMPTDPHHTPTIIQPSTSQPQKKQRSRRSKRKDTEVPQPSGPTTNVADEAVNEEMDDSLERAATTATGLEAEQDSGNIDKTQSKATLNEPSSSGTSSGSGPRRQETMGDTIAQTRSENVSKLSNDPLLARGNTLRSGEDRLKLEELMALCTTLQSRVLALETTKTTQATEIASLKKRVKETTDSEADRIPIREDTLILYGDEVIVKSVDVVKTAEETRIKFKREVNATLAELKSAKPKATTITTTPTLTTTAAITIIAISTRPKAKGIVFHEQEQAPTPTVSSQQPS